VEGKCGLRCWSDRRPSGRTVLLEFGGIVQLSQQWPGAVRLGASCDPLNAIQSRQLSDQRWKLAGTRLDAEYVVTRSTDDVLRIVTPRPLAVSATGEHAWIEVGTGVEDSL
jgi:hypothetical protein